MKNMVGFLMFLFIGFLIGIISKNDLLFGIFFLVAGIVYSIWTFYKMEGWFKEGRKINRLLLFLFAELAGFNLGVFDVIKVDTPDKYIFGFLIFVLFLAYIIISDSIGGKARKNK